MPYCPKCDMEFIDGITVCSDCGGPLAESKEVADAMKKQQKEEELARQKAAYEEMQAALAQEQANDDSRRLTDGGTDPEPALAARLGHRPERTHVYVKKSQQYDDLKSSASAFLIIGGALLAVSVLCWINLLQLPMAQGSRMIMQSVLTVMGVLCLIVAFRSTQSARRMRSQISQEEDATKQLVQWFLDNYQGPGLDAQIAEESGELEPEELSLKRFDLIQDILITSHDLADQSYVDLLAEEIYGKLYEN